MVPPSPVKIVVTAADIRVLSTLAEKRNEYRGYRARADRWGQGLTSDAVLRGLVGELAFCRFVNRRLGTHLSVNTDDLPAGDKDIDFDVYGVGVQVKTRRRRGVLLIRRQTEAGRLLTFRWDVCVSTTWETHAPDGDQEVTIDGWIGRAAAPVFGPFGVARIGEHMNLDVPDHDLSSPESLLDWFQSAQQWGGPRP